MLWLGAGFFVALMTGFYAGSQSVSTQAQQALFADRGPFMPPARTKVQTCAVQDALPDPDCTPGAIFPEATKDQVCVSGYTKTVRNVQTTLKKQVYREYGIAYPPTYGTYEADHFIPLALGGSNDIANLFPEAAEPQPGFREKDLVENYLHIHVCDGTIPLAAAQRAIATDWVAVYNAIDQSELSSLKQAYKNWSQGGD